MSEVREVEAPVEYPGAVRHPSGWWKARDGKWYRPEETPGRETRDITDVVNAHNADETGDLVTALSIAVGAIVFGSLVGAHHELTLLIGGTAGALVARWHLFSRADRGLLTAVAALCVSASGVLVLDVARATRTSTQLQSSVLVATAGALMATMIATVMAMKLRAAPQPR